ncbi:hydroxymethylglutaryl-CoA lyase [Gulosibacter faecalis]|uniref:Hydroxymethylglutaryl-CoA lyase n=1 Tax=Gulosibacter faecalis TaxID=272240 RepID=A0ABW5UW72_9MICO|nr:hydroxymethylglutaryl-CoA lyase [Gulosibacter faecalis]
MSHVEVTDVYLRDGLQDEAVVVPTATKLEIARALIAAGVPRIEVTSFVHPRRVPQLADADDLVAQLPERGATYAALVLNDRGVDRAVAAGRTQVELVVSASEAHSAANAGRSIADALSGLAGSVRRHPEAEFVAGVSTAFECPFEGAITPDRLERIVGALLEMGVTTIGLADTLGTASTAQVLASVDAVREAHPGAALSLHLHNANGQALDTVIAAAREGIDRFDGALAGYGGCPFAPGAHGNLATESIVAALHANGFTTGIGEARLADAASAARRAVAEGTPIPAPASA